MQSSKSRIHSRTRSGRVWKISEDTEDTTPTTQEELAAQVERLREELQQKYQELVELKTTAARTNAGLESKEDHVETLHRQLEQAELLAEVAKLYSLETVRAELR